MGDDHSLTAVFTEPEHNDLTVAVIGSGSTSPSVGTHTYEDDTLVPVNASAGSGWLFSHWLLDSVDVGSDNPYTVIMGDDHSLTAVFTDIPMKVDVPVFSPAGGTYFSSQSVALSCSTDGATIRYTLDGSEPTSSSEIYSAPISVSSGTVTVKAKAFKSGMTDSDTASATYTINPQNGTTDELIVWLIPLAIIVAVIAIIVIVMRKRRTKKVTATAEVKFS